MTRAGFALAGMILALGPAAGAVPGPRNVVAVLSSESRYYREALAGLEAELGGPVAVTVLPDRPALPDRVRVIVAFGARAARASFPSRATLVYCLAPGVRVEAGGGRMAVRVDMLPPARAVLARLRELQPGLRTLAVFWLSGSVEDAVRGMREAAAAAGLALRAARLRDAEELPDRLRGLRDKPDAIWIPPDPLLVTERNFAVLREYSWANGVPIYAPTAGLAEKGAAVALSSGYQDIGRAAALAVRNILEDGTPPEAVYPERLETALNLGAAARTGLVFSRSILASADRVIP